MSRLVEDRIRRILEITEPFKTGNFAHGEGALHRKLLLKKAELAARESKELYEKAVEQEAYAIEYMRRANELESMGVAA